MNDIQQSIRQFIIDSFLFGNSEELTDETSFLDEGIIDSTGVLEFVSFIEDTFAIEIADEELIPENLDSIRNATNYIRSKTIMIAAA